MAHEPERDFEALERAFREAVIASGLVTASELEDRLELMYSRTSALGARMVARAWFDPAYRMLLLADGSAAARELLGIDIGALKLIVVANTPLVHNLVVCTLCSCYPRMLLGMPPDWYKSVAYRSRAVREPRAVLAEFGLVIADDVVVRVHDSTADMRYLVLPMRPDFLAEHSEAACAAFVSRDDMIGAAIPDRRHADGERCGASKRRRMQLLDSPLLATEDPELYAAVRREEQRQRENLELIASENYASRAVREASASVLTNKYAEGYPGKRYYGGCEYVDVAETLAIDRAKALFGADHANVQPHAGAQANMAVFMAVLQPGDTILGLKIDHGGHLTHGTKVSFSGKLYNAAAYGVRRDTELIDYDEVRALAREHKPKLIIAGASAYPRTMDYAPFVEIAREVGALFFVDMAHIAGLVAAGLHPSPVPLADFVTTTTHKTLRGPRGGLILTTSRYAAAIDKSVFPGIQGGPMMQTIAAKAVAFGEAQRPSFREYQERVIANARAMGEELARAGARLVAGGTDTHLVLVDVGPKHVTGKAVEAYLDEIKITVNKNGIPFDPQKPAVTSGIRIGSPAITTRGMGVDDAREIGKIIGEALDDVARRARIDVLRARVTELTSRYDVP